MCGLTEERTGVAVRRSEGEERGLGERPMRRATTAARRSRGGAAVPVRGGVPEEQPRRRGAPGQFLAAAASRSPLRTQARLPAPRPHQPQQIMRVAFAAARAVTACPLREQLASRLPQLSARICFLAVDCHKPKKKTKQKSICRPPRPTATGVPAPAYGRARQWRLAGPHPRPVPVNVAAAPGRARRRLAGSPARTRACPPLPAPGRGLPARNRARFPRLAGPQQRPPPPAWPRLLAARRGGGGWLARRPAPAPTGAWARLAAPACA
ncbi:translation initiation factor IF-2-like [Panicum virgatum]|uniref:translation initiation factor IF-2-like n=1 Tax=Panicum virgatum TaxID=38727 RepID=UPI0019D5A9A1|nr:translation initiation factor IF-2-like [Panicum virgatum]